MAHKLFCVAQVCERDPALSVWSQRYAKTDCCGCLLRVEVKEAELPLLQIFPLPIGLSQICGCSICSVLSLINWRGFKLQEHAASRL